MTVLGERKGSNVREPHAVLSKISWYACGGISPLKNTPVKICRVPACVKSVDNVLDPTINLDIVSRDNKIREIEQALREVVLEDAELDSSRSDYEAKKFVDVHAAVKDFRFELRISLKAEIKELPDNKVKEENRLDSRRKRAMKDES